MNDSGAFHRPPRSFPPALPKDKIVVARPPTLNRRGVGTFVQMILPVLGSFGIVALAIIMPNKLFLIVAGVFVAIAVFSVVASRLAQRRSGKLSARTERRLYRAHLDERRGQFEIVTERQRQVDERLYPDPARLAGLVSHRRHLWERRPSDGDFLAFRLGRARRRSRVRSNWPSLRTRSPSATSLRNFLAREGVTGAETIVVGGAGIVATSLGKAGLLEGALPTSNSASWRSRSTSRPRAAW